MKDRIGYEKYLFNYVLWPEPHVNEYWVHRIRNGRCIDRYGPFATCDAADQQIEICRQQDKETRDGQREEDREADVGASEN